MIKEKRKNSIEQRDSLTRHQPTLEEMNSLMLRGNLCRKDMEWRKTTQQVTWEIQRVDFLREKDRTRIQGWDSMTEKIKIPRTQGRKTTSTSDTDENLTQPKLELGWRIVGTSWRYLIIMKTIGWWQTKKMIVEWITQASFRKKAWKTRFSRSTRK